LSKTDLKRKMTLSDVIVTSSFDSNIFMISKTNLCVKFKPSMTSLNKKIIYGHKFILLLTSLIMTSSTGNVML